MIITAHNLRKYIESESGTLKVLENISFTANKGDFIGIMGPSGSGKSTLLFLLGCLDYPTIGSIFIDDIDVAQANEKTRELIRLNKIGFVFQNFKLLPTLTVIENVMLPMNLANSFKGPQRSHRALSLLRIVGLQDKANDRPQNLSGGQQQRVAIARALANNPGVILADEPTGNLDGKTSKEIMDVFKTINEMQEITIFVVTHDPKVASVADRIFYLEGGKLRGTVV